MEDKDFEDEEYAERAEEDARKQYQENALEVI